MSKISTFPLSTLLSPVVRQRLPFAVRVGVCCGLPVMIGYFAGNIHLGLLATLGSFTALYGSDRPYINRGWYLAVVALLLAVVVMLGMLPGNSPWAAVMVVSAISTIATFVCNATRVGAPGAYMFALACASGTGISAVSSNPWQSGLWVLLGGGISWGVHMSGALFHRYKPEQTAVAGAANAVSQFAACRDVQRRIQLRLDASQKIDNAWMALLNRQSGKTRQTPCIQYLISLTQQLSPIIARAEMTAVADKTGDDVLAQQAKQIAQSATTASKTCPQMDTPVVLPEAQSGLRFCQENLFLWSVPFQMALRVCLATLVAGAAGAWLGLNHAYWIMAAVVVVLNQPYGWPGTTRRAIYRVVGTLAGILLAWGVLSLHPEGLWIALAVGVLQFIIQIFVVVQYAIAAIFITTFSMLITLGGGGLQQLNELLGARALDTVIGCGVAIAVFMLMLPCTALYQVFAEMRATLMAAQRLAESLSQENHLTSSVLSRRISLRRRLLSLQQTADDDVDAAKLRHPKIEPLVKAVSVSKTLSWKLLAAASYTTDQHTPDDYGAPLNEAQYQQISCRIEDLLQSENPKKRLDSHADYGFLQQELDNLEQAYRQLQPWRRWGDKGARPVV
ncbi:FUSC family protein [Tatumella sp. UBA2305]|uniref:FUSC family protein n=1 Tax=Tatumella sp. UBA2305 TaxID=1947647 RepID=UPI0025DA9472|nr:FUSC family protein [Tatumella sp. UBA2305]